MDKDSSDEGPVDTGFFKKLNEGVGAADSSDDDSEEMDDGNPKDTRTAAQKILDAKMGRKFEPAAPPKKVEMEYNDDYDDMDLSLSLTKKEPGIIKPQRV